MRRAPREQLGEDVSDQSTDSFADTSVEDLGLHDVDAGVDGVGEHLPPGGLLQEALDPPVLVGDDDAELERVRAPA